jgi:hypothetical protein
MSTKNKALVLAAVAITITAIAQWGTTVGVMMSAICLFIVSLTRR